MAEFHEIGSSQFTDVTPTGEEKIQISASQRTTLQNIANLAPEKGVKQVVVTNFQTNTWKLSDGGSVSFPNDIKVGEIVTFKSAQDAVKGPGVELFGYAIKHNSLMASYVGMTTSNKVNGIPTIYTYKSAGAYATAWQQLPDASVKTVEITDFAIPGLNITKDGESFLFYANDASNIPNSNHGATSFVGVAIASPIFITGDQRLLYYMMVDTASGMFYTGHANLEDDTVAWNTTPVTRLGKAVQVTAFTEAALGALLYSYKPGDFIPFYTSSVTASEVNQFPESGIFNGFISMGSNEGDYFQIFAFKSGSTKAYLGACIGSTTQWTALEGGGAQTVIRIAANQNVFDVGLYPFTKLGEMFPIFIDTSATNNPSKEGYPCAGTVQCVGYQGPESWEAVFVVGSADEDQTPRGDYYKAHLSYDMGGSAWIELTTGSSGGTELLFVGDTALANAAPEIFNLGGEVHDGDLLMIVYDFISSDHTMVGPKAGRSIIWTATSGTYDVTVEAFDYSSATGGVSIISGFNLMLSASGTILSMEATGEVDTIIEAFHVVGIYRLSKAL